MKSLLRNFLIGAIVLYVGLLIQREGFDGDSSSPSSQSPSSPPSTPSTTGRILGIVLGVIVIIVFFIVVSMIR